MEAIDHEGRPGAGLGIQFPVRTTLIWAVGELQDKRAVSVLLPFLNDDAGSPTGGFYLAAMDALWKLGPTAVPELRRAASTGDATVACNARHLLSELERTQ
jgi:HEAT repeat protein